jgi:hypothetical protein
MRSRRARSTARVDENRVAIALAAVDDSVSDGVGRPELANRRGDRLAIGITADGRQVAVADQRVVVVEQPQLEAARARVDDQHSQGNA